MATSKGDTASNPHGAGSTPASDAADTPGSLHGDGKPAAAASGPRSIQRAENTMNRILLVDLGERELKERQKLRARRQVLETIDKTSETSGGLSAAQLDELANIVETLSSDIVADPFYRVVASTYAQQPWEVLAGGGTDFVHKYGLIGSQRIPVNFLSALQAGEREIVGICGLLQLDGVTDAGRRGFVQKVSAAQGEYRESRALFDAAFALLSGKYPVTLRSQIQAKLIDEDILGCISPGGMPQGRKPEALKPKATATALAAEERKAKVLEARLAASTAMQNALAKQKLAEDTEAKATAKDRKAEELKGSANAQAQAQALKDEAVALRAQAKQDREEAKESMQVAEQKARDAEELKAKALEEKGLKMIREPARMRTTRSAFSAAAMWPR